MTPRRSTLEIGATVRERFHEREGIVRSLTFNDGESDHGIRHVEVEFDGGAHRRWFYPHELREDDRG